MALLLKLVKCGRRVADVPEGVEEAAVIVVKQDEEGRGRRAGRTKASAAGGGCQHKTEATTVSRNRWLGLGE